MVLLVNIYPNIHTGSDGLWEACVFIYFSDVLVLYMIHMTLMCIKFFFRLKHVQGMNKYIQISKLQLLVYSMM